MERYKAGRTWAGQTELGLVPDIAGDAILYADYLAKLADIRGAVANERGYRAQLDINDDAEFVASYWTARDTLDALLSEAE